MRKDVVRPPINVTFERQVNYAGVEQPACTLCGDCCSGCNVGSKNTVQVTYLADAYNHGAEIFTEMRVSHVRRERGRWRVFFEPLGHEREKFAAAEQSITADVVVLAAGTLGSTEILLRSREKGLPVSDQRRRALHRQRRRARLRLQQRRAGQRHRRRRAAAAAETGPGRSVHHRPHRSARHAEARRRHGDRGGLDPLGAGARPAGAAGRRRATASARIPTRASSTSSASGRAERQSLLFGAYQGAVNRTQTYLVMSHDDGKGRVTLENGGAKLTWPNVAKQPIFEKVDRKPPAGDHRDGRRLHAQPAHRHASSATTSSPCIRSAAASWAATAPGRRQPQVPGVRWAPASCRRRRASPGSMCATAPSCRARLASTRC